MEDLVAIRVTHEDGSRHYLMTWGRLFDAVDPEGLLDAITPHLSRFGLQKHKEVFLCYTLAEASDQPYFYEALFNFSRQGIPFGDGYKKWRKKKKRSILSGEGILRGKDILYLGDKRKFD